MMVATDAQLVSEVVGIYRRAKIIHISSVGGEGSCIPEESGIYRQRAQASPFRCYRELNCLSIRPCLCLLDLLLHRLDVRPLLLLRVLKVILDAHERLGVRANASAS